MKVTKYNMLLDDDMKAILVKENSTYCTEVDSASSPIEIIRILNTVFNAEHLPEEHMWMLAMNAKNKLIGIFEVAHGQGIGCSFTPREFFMRACAIGANVITIAHNHPSGDCSPSAVDDSATRRIVAAGRMIGIPVVDHIIVGRQSWYSYAAENEEIIKTKSCKNIA